MIVDKQIGMIVASDLNGVIGYDGKIPWGMNRTDMARFKSITLNSSIIMGRKTWESIGRPLPKRKNIVISRTIPHIDGAFVVGSLMDAIRSAGSGEGPVWIIGGGDVYKQALEERLVDVVDHTVLGVATNVGNGEEGAVRESKITGMPPIPLYYQFISEEVNGEDDRLHHRTYRIRPNWKRNL
jgi:dihydrofolate reductase